MGSVTDKIFYAVTNPLFIVRGREEGGVALEAKLASISVPLDGSAITERILSHSVSLSKALAIPICLVSVILSEQPHAHEEDHLQQQDERLADQDATPLCLGVTDGDAANAIVDLSNEFPEAFVVSVTDRAVH